MHLSNMYLIPNSEDISFSLNEIVKIINEVPDFRCFIPFYYRRIASKIGNNNNLCSVNDTKVLMVENTSDREWIVTRILKHQDC